MQTFLSMAEVRAMAAPHEALWVDAHRHAQDEWWGSRNMASEIFQAAGPTARAATIHDLVTAHVKRAPGVAWTDKLEFFAQIIDAGSVSLLVRFKLLDRQMRTANHHSEQQDLLDLHEFKPEALAELTLDGMSGTPVPITCGYVLSAGEISIEQIVVACHYERRPYFYYDLEVGLRQEALFLRGFEPAEPSFRSRREDSETGSE
jgi:hypothetical protein